MAAAELFDQLVREHVAPLLRGAGFKRQRNTFRRTQSDVVHVVNLQKSTSSTAQAVKFAVNLGIASTSLLARDEVAVEKLLEPDCHWRQRLREAPFDRESWWVVADASSMEDGEHSMKLELDSERHRFSSRRRELRHRRP